jgi:2-methylisocitrate lyase-like PEP mutase family enzyme
MPGNRAALRRRLEGAGLVVAPGVFDMISARIADGLGFDALYMTGYGISASHLGLPDAGFATLTDMVERVRRIAAGTATPLIADADTGYGGALNVRHTVQVYEAAGAAAIQLEDQEFPKPRSSRSAAATPWAAGSYRPKTWSPSCASRSTAGPIPTS